MQWFGEKWCVLALVVSGCGTALTGKKHADGTDPAPADPAATVTQKDAASDASTRPATDTATSSATDSATGTGTGTDTDRAMPHVVCKMPAGAPTKLDKIADLVALLNLLPRPVSIACLLEVLPKPLGITATSGPISIQPALDGDNPRIFLFLGTTVLAVVPDGPYSNLLELSELLNDTQSVKGELVFPVDKDLSKTAPYDQAYRTDGVVGTRCGACHNFEAVQAGAEYGGRAFVSEALRSLNSEVVTLGRLRGIGLACDGQTTARCDIMRALIGTHPADVKEQLFPPGMPTMF